MSEDTILRRCFQFTSFLPISIFCIEGNRERKTILFTQNFLVRLEKISSLMYEKPKDEKFKFIWCKVNVGSFKHPSSFGVESTLDPSNTRSFGSLIDLLVFHSVKYVVNSC